MSTGARPGAGFGKSLARFEEMTGWLDGTGAAGLTHAELEDQLERCGRALMRQLLQDHLDLRACREERVPVTDAAGAARTRVEAGHARELASVFGPVGVARLAYRRPGQANLHPADAALNLPEESYSHGLRRRAAIESTRGSFDAATDAVQRGTGQRIPKRQLEDLAHRAGTDFAAFYACRTHQPVADTDVLVLTVDGKGIVMRPGALRPATAKAAAKTANKLTARLSKGEKRNRKRMAEVGAVYDLTPAARTAADIYPDRERDPDTHPPPAPKAANKWLTASVVDDAAEVIAQVFAEADRRDPGHQRTTIALVDGNNHQIERIHAEAQARGLNMPILIDIVHVSEYVWGAAWSFYPEADPAAQAWVRQQMLAILQGHARRVATTIRRKATLAGLDAGKRNRADACADYLTSKAEHLDYPTALAAGWPIATGIIEGACRYLVADRMDITGARWSVHGAEAVLKLRALQANGDFDEYWTYHLAQEHDRVHRSRYADKTLPSAA